MNLLSSSSAPSRLYAFLLKLRPLKYGTLMPFSGEMVHAAWLNWLKSAAPDVAEWLHEGNKRRLFTCSSLQFPLQRQRMRDAERDNLHMPVEPEKLYTLRVTLLQGELFPLFHDALMNFNAQTTQISGNMKPPFMQLGKQTFMLEEVIITGDDTTDTTDTLDTTDTSAAGWTGFTSCANLVEQALSRKVGRVERLKLEFDSLTTFNRGSARNKAYGNYSALLPLPTYVFPGLARRWQDVAPPELARHVQHDRVEQYCLDEGIVISDYALRPHRLKFTTHIQPGFVGTCTYDLRGPDEPAAADSSLTVRQQILLLARLAFYTSVGYKTAMGLGRTRMVDI
jgi:hypothetical protein